LFLFLQPSIFANSEPLKTKESSKAAAATYNELFSSVDDLAEELGDKYSSLFYPSDEEKASSLTEQEKAEVLKVISEQLESLSQVAQQPEVDFGKAKYFEEAGPAALIPELGQIRRLILQTRWHAKETWQDDSDKALNNLLNAQAAARHINQETTLISLLTSIACERICLSNLSELSPKMTPDQRKKVLNRISQLPRTGSLAEALLAEKQYMTGWYKHKILAALSKWEEEHYGTDGFRFPQDLRLAGVVLMPDLPPRISLHNTRKNHTFWLEKGKEIHGIRLDRVEHVPTKAWIIHDGITAVIDLQKETIENRYVPWEVLYSVFISEDYEYQDRSEADRQRQLTELGMTPESALDHLERVEAFFDEAVTKLDLPIDEFEKWQDEQVTSFPKDSFGSMMIPSVSKVLEVQKSLQTNYNALELGFKLQAEESLKQPKDSGFVLRKNDGGFTLIPEEYIGHEKEYNYSSHFGTPPPKPN
jgi:hypothetical protein